MKEDMIRQAGGSLRGAERSDTPCCARAHTTRFNGLSLIAHSCHIGDPAAAFLRRYHLKEVTIAGLPTTYVIFALNLFRLSERS